MKDWENVYKTHGEIQKKVEPLIESAVALFKEHGLHRILDLGCGTGRHTVFLMKNGFDVYGIDISKKAIEISSKKLNDLGFKPKLKVNDMSSMDFDDGFFDGIVSTYTIFHSTIEKFRKTIAEIYRILKPGGLFIFNAISVKDGWYGKGKEIEKNTFKPTMHPDEADIPHHFFSKNEIISVISEQTNFNILNIHHSTGWSKRRNTEMGFWNIIAKKPGP
jgi:cyclopropane fatty-acyl-phospholipid synthase-like methyltransferase